MDDVSLPVAFQLQVDDCPFCGGKIDVVCDLEVFDGECYASGICGGCGMHFMGCGFGGTPEEAVFDAKIKLNRRYAEEALLRRNDSGILVCDVCGSLLYDYDGWAFCPHCGAHICGCAER